MRGGEASGKGREIEEGERWGMWHRGGKEVWVQGGGRGQEIRGARKRGKGM